MENKNEPFKAGGADFQPGRMQKSFDQWVDEERAEHNMGDETTEGGAASGGGAVTEVVPSPTMKSDLDMNQNPNQVVDPEIVKSMGAAPRF